MGANSARQRSRTNTCTSPHASDVGVSSLRSLTSISRAKWGSFACAALETTRKTSGSFVSGELSKGRGPVPAPLPMARP
jgi:hypothetical protein